jgi:hypothetical protein
MRSLGKVMEKEVFVGDYKLPKEWGVKIIK